LAGEASAGTASADCSPWHWSSGTNGLAGSPRYNWRARLIFRVGSAINSCQWVTQPTVRATANCVVDMLVGSPIALSVMPARPNLLKPSDELGATKDQP